jgi:hypothetical protein
VESERAAPSGAERWKLTARRGTTIASDRSRSEVVLVNAPSGDYVFCLITRNQQDESWRPDKP